MKLPLRRRSEHPRGQGLVEFALIIPLLALMLVFAIDFGRVFFGWVGLQNVARIAADYAAQHPIDGWDTASANFATYKAQIEADATGINCTLPDPLPAPTFPDGTSPGADAVVHITCDFSLITPLAGSIVGNPLTIAAEATFPIRAGVVGGGSGGGGGGGDPALCRNVPDLSDMLVEDARAAWSMAGFSGTFFPVTGNDTQLVDSQTTTPASSPGDCIDFRSTVSVTSSDPAPPCTSPQVLLPSLVGLSVDDARTRWDDQGFDPANFTPGLGFGSEVVTSQTTTPDTEPGTCADPTLQVEVEHETAPPGPPCLVPNFVGTRKNGAQTTWSGAGFSTTVQLVGGPGNWTIQRQDVEANVWVNCDTTNITVFDS